jgi:adenine/guanine phosphoribosyltransferase-like PRPP-binding protein
MMKTIVQIIIIIGRSIMQRFFNPSLQSTEPVTYGQITLGSVSKAIPFKKTPDGSHYFLFMRLIEHPEFVKEGARLVAERVKELGLANPYFVTPEASTITLAETLRDQYNIDGRIIFKTIQSDDVDPIEADYSTITSTTPKKLYLGKNHVAEMQNKDIIILDSICTTGGTIGGVYQLLAKAGIPVSRIVEATMLFVEGQDRSNIEVAEGVQLKLHRFNLLPFIPADQMRCASIASPSATV